MLRLIGMALGINLKEPAANPKSSIEDAVHAGIPMTNVLPDDPELALLDAPIGTSL